MNLDSLTAALSHIGYLITSLNKKTLYSSVQELKELLEIFGEEAELHLYRVILNQVEWSVSTADLKGPNPNGNNNSPITSATLLGGKEGSDSPVSTTYLVFGGSSGTALVLLLQQLATFIPLERFAAFLAVAISSPFKREIIKSNWVNSVCKVLKLTKVQEIIVCFQVSLSDNSELVDQALNLLEIHLPELLRNYTQSENNVRELSDISIDTLHLILTEIVSLNHKSVPIVSSDLRKEFLSAVEKEFPRSQTPLVLLPILYPESDPLIEALSINTFSNMTKYLVQSSLADYVQELGYNFCNSVEECKSILVNFGEQSVTPAAVAKVLGVMIKSHSNLHNDQLGLQSIADVSSLWGDSKDKTVGTPSRTLSNSSTSDGNGGGSSSTSANTWNVEVFIKALLEVSPSISPKAIASKLDYEGFFVSDKKGLQLLVTAFRCLLQSQGIRTEMFPMDCFYKVWKNPDEQLQLFEQILLNSDVFCLSDYPCRLVSTEGLKNLPELDNKNIASWKSLDLIELLLRLADGGHYTVVKELLKIPIQHCPDILILGLVQVSMMYTAVRSELILSLIPLFLGNHPNGMSVLQIIWQSQKDASTVKELVIRSMADWYMAMENDQMRLSKIFDVAQDLKALSMLLNAQPFVFVIDLACLAYRREYLNLEKWLNGKIRDHGEVFVIHCIKFLQRRCPLLVGGKDDLLPKSSQLPHDTVSAILACLQANISTLPQEYQDLIITMAQNSPLLNRQRQVGSQLGFNSQSDSLSGIASSLSTLGLGSSTSSMFASPVVSSSLNLGSSLAGLGSIAPPGSPARPLTLSNLASSATLPPTSQSSLSSLLPSLQLGSTVPAPQHSAVGSQLPSLPSTLSAGLRSQSVQPPITPNRQNELRSLDNIAQIFEIPPIISKEVEDEANSYFQRIYNQPPHPTLSTEEILEMLKNFHESSNKREREVYSCMLKNLFEEYRFFPTYPERELILTAQLFGGIIEQGLVEYIALGLALRYILEALQKPHGSKMFYFGIVALDRFKARLKEYPRYCHHLMSIEHFSDFPQHLIEYIKYGTQSQEPPNRPTGPVLPTTMSISPTTPVAAVSSAIITTNQPTISVVKTSTSTATTNSSISRPQLGPIASKPTIATTNIETLLVATEKEEKLSPPPDHIQDKIAFIFNNLSQLNLPQKCDELKEIIGEEYYPWVSRYLVMKRVSIENNFHTLYSLFLDQLNLNVITNLVLQETLRNVKVLLRAEKSEVNSSDKALLKNLGHWLGMLTLAKNKPILHLDIDMKSLLIEAYRKGVQEMQHVVPFVAKVIESCAKSRVFKPPNPWTMGIMNVMAELHKEPDMKLHLKFEIEVLCNKLDINVKDLKPGSVLKNTETLSRIKPQLSQAIGKRAESTPLFSTIQGSVPTPPTIVSSSVQSTTPNQIQALAPVQMEQQRFVYSDISLSSIRCFDAHITVSTPQIANLETNTQLKQLVRHAVELAVQEIITAVIECSFKVAITTTEIIIKKDFALEPDESRMRAAAHHMVRNLTAARAMITCKDHLATAISKGIKQGILSGFNRQKTSPQQLEQVEQLASTIAQENIGIACAFIQKTAAEKAVLELDKRFNAEYEARKLARSEGRRFCDARVFTYQMETMPEPIRMKVGRVTPQQTVVYEEFARNIPGFVPIVEDDSLLISKPIPLTNTFNSNDESCTFFLMTERITAELENIIQAFNSLAPTSSLIQMLHSLLEGIIFYRGNRESSAVQILVKRAVDNLLEGIRELPSEPELNQLALRFRDIHLITLKAMADQRAFGPTWTSKFVTKFWTESRDEIRYNLEVMDWMLRSSLVNVQMLDEHLQRTLEEARLTSNFTPMLFIMHLVQVYLIDDATGTVLNDSDLPLTLECLLRLCQNRQAPDTLLSLIEALRMKHDVLSGGGGSNTSSNDRLSTALSVTTPNSLASTLVNSLARSAVAAASNNNGNMANMQASSNHFHSGVTQARDFHDPPGLQEKTDALLREWIQMYHAPTAGHGSTTAFQHFVKNMDLHGILKTDEIITRFFRICITMCRDLCIRSISEFGNSSPTYVRNKCFPNLDAFVRLISLLVKQSGEPSNPTAKINLLNKVLGLICGIMLHDIDTHGNDFHQLPYHRILIMLFLELNAPETVLETINLPVLVAFTQTLHLLRPSKCPGFGYAWLELVSHRVFIGRMLAITPQQKGWSMYSMLLTDLFKFLAPFLRNVDLAKPFTMLYKGTLRVLLVLLHDFPEFLCDYHYAFCDVIPPNCIQMRNLILSAYPRNMRLPDPFMPNLKVDRLQEISVSPKIHPNIPDLIQPTELKKNLDAYLKNRSNVNFLSELRSYLQVSNEPGMRYNMSLMNALVLYVGMQAITQIQAKGMTPSMTTIAHTAHMDIFENFAVDLDTEGRYLFLIAIANQLRYPNSHTHYFSCTLLYLFNEANNEAIQEQITRVLLERLIGNRPQPWGLLITFIELIKNPTFKFWSHDFVKCAPEIEKIFESVARSCMAPKGTQSTESN